MLCYYVKFISKGILRNKSLRMYQLYSHVFNCIFISCLFGYFISSQLFISYSTDIKAWDNFRRWNEEGADVWSHPKSLQSTLQEKNERSNERMLSFFSPMVLLTPTTHSHPSLTAVGRLFLSRRSLSTEQAGVEKEDVQTTQRKLRWGVDVAESRRMFVLGVGKEGWKTGGADLQTALRRG